MALGEMVGIVGGPKILLESNRGEFLILGFPFNCILFNW